jgi:hypothetical protein
LSKLIPSQAKPESQCKSTVDAELQINGISKLQFDPVIYEIFITISFEPDVAPAIVQSPVTPKFIDDFEKLKPEGSGKS